MSTRLDLSWTLPAAVAFAETDTTESNGTHLTGLAVPLGVPSQPSADGHRYMFSGPPDNPDELVDVVVEHHEDQVAGRLAEPWVTEDTGLLARARGQDREAPGADPGLPGNQLRDRQRTGHGGCRRGDKDLRGAEPDGRRDLAQRRSVCRRGPEEPDDLYSRRFLRR